MKYRQQFDETDCGAACLAMIASHFEQQLSVAQIRDISGTDTDGTNLKGIIKAASNYGLKATALKGDKNSISEKLPIPFIAHLKIEFDDIHWTYHYVVGSISSFSRGKDSRGTKGGHWTERSEGSGWSDSETPNSLFFAKQKATRKIKI